MACIIVDWVRIPVIVTMGANGAYWRQAGLLSLVSIFPILWFKYVSCRRRPDLQPTFWGAITIPVYKQLYYLVSIVGAIRALVFYIGGHKLPLTAKQMIEAGDERVLWLDARWATNKAFLADEGVALRAAEENEAANDCTNSETDPKLESLVVTETAVLPPLITLLPETHAPRRERVD